MESDSESEVEEYHGLLAKKFAEEPPPNPNIGQPIRPLVPITLTFTTPTTPHDPKHVQLRCKDGTKLYKILWSIYELRPPFNFRYRVLSVALKRANRPPKYVKWKERHVYENDGFDVVVKRSHKPRVNPNAVQEDLSELLEMTLDMEEGGC